MTSSKIFPQSATFRHLNINDGLSQNTVFAIHQDKKGFMWFGTKDGLNRHDGYDFKIFQHDPFDSTTISSSYITSIFEDSRGLLWIGTEKGGLNLFDPIKETFRQIPLYSAFSGKTAVREIRDIAEDLEGKMWIGTKGDGLFQVYKTDSQGIQYEYKQYLHNPSNEQSLCNNVVSAIYVDKAGLLWLGTEQGLNILDPTTDSFTHYLLATRNPLAPYSDYENSIGAIASPSEDFLWIGTQGGLIHFDKISGKFIYYPHQFDVFRYGWGAIKAIKKDKEGALWMPTSAMLMRFDTKTKTYRYLTNDPLNLESIAYNSVSSVCIDDQGIIWVGTSGLGISKLDPKANRFNTLRYINKPGSRISSFSIRSVLEESKDVVWISGEVLYRWDRKTNSIESYETSSNRPNDFGNTGAWSMIKASTGLLWFASNEGLYYYDPLTSKSVQIKKDSSSGLPQRSVYAVYEDRKQAIWIMTENYICKLVNKEEETFDCYKYNKKPAFSEQVRPVIYQDEKNIFWIGTNEGFMRFDPEKEVFKSYLVDPENSNSIVNNQIKVICPDPLNPNSHLWIGTAGGLSYFSITYERFINYTDKNGLPNNVVYGILPDHNGNLWLSTNKGLSMFNPNNRDFRNFDIKDGLQSNEFNTGAYFLSSDGEMYFGGINGVNNFYPSNIKNNPNAPTIVLTAILANSAELNQATHPDIISGSISSLNQVTLPHHNKVLTFRFAALDYSAPDKNQYAYMMENYNDDWIYAGTINSATYTNLPPGNYTFRVKGSNSDGIWNEEGISINLSIMPPWWASGWAYLIYILILIGTVLWIRNHELRRIKIESQLALEQVELISLRDLDKMKTQFFANISHEFRTPLTLILGQLESVLDHEKNSTTIDKLKVANRYAEKLLGLINQLLDLSKIEAKGMKLQLEPADLVFFLKSTFFGFESMAESKKIKLEFHSNEPVILTSIDKEKMEIITSNLVSNAIKFTRSGGKVVLSVSRIDTTQVEIIIEDTGIGIHEADLSKIFERFYQANSTGLSNYEGTGIGLALTKELVKLHGGEISVNSKPGVGTVFVIHFPVGAPEADFDQPVNNSDTTSKYATPAVGANSNKECILLVEDNDDVRSFIKAELSVFYQVAEAADGATGFELAKIILPDLIITDIMMPVMDGYEFSRKLRQEEKTGHIPIIMLTAKSGFDDKIAGLELGIDDYLTKPFKSKELLTRVRNLIDQRKKLRMRFSKATRISPSEVSVVSVDQVFIEKVLHVIEHNMCDEAFTVERIAEDLNMSLSQLNKKLKALIDQPGGQLIRSIRLQRAADLIVKNAGTISEICYSLGFSDQAYFSRAFKKHFGVSPSLYKQNEVNNVD